MGTNLKKNATLLTVLMLVKKLLSIVYKIPYQNLTGDAGFYVFQQVYPFIALLMLLTGFALPTVVGGLLAENHYSNPIKDKLKRLMWLFSLLMFVVFFLGNRQVALLMGDVLLAPVIRIVGVHFLFLSPIAYMRGVLQSRTVTMKKLGYSVVVEQLARVLAVLFALLIFNVNNHGYYRIAELALIFSLVSPIITIMHLYLMKPIDDVQSFLPLKEKPQIFRRVLFLTLGAGILAIFAMVDSFLVFNLLVTTHSQVDARILRGVLERGLPIIQAGTFFVGSMVTLTMSQFEKAESEKKKRIAFSTGFFYILALAIPATIGLLMIMPYLNTALFLDQSGNRTLQIMTLQIALYSIIVLLTATLTKEKREPFVLASLLVGILIKLLLTGSLVQQLGIDGAAWSSVISLAVMCLIMLFASKHLFTPKLLAIFIGISFSTFIMWLVLLTVRGQLVFLHTEEREGSFYLVLIHTFIGIIVYGIALIILISIFKTIGNLILRRHHERQERVKRAIRARDRKREEARRNQEAKAQEAQRIKAEAIQKEQYRQSLMQNKPKKSAITANEHLEGRGYQSKEPHIYYQQPPQARRQTTKKAGKTMRLDKFLKVSRIIKRRQTAKEVSDAGKISVNGKVAKSSTSLHVGDEITLHYATRTLVVRVIEIKDSTKKEDAERMYEVVREEAARAPQS